MNGALVSLDPSEKPVQSLADAEEEQIRKVLAATDGNKTRAAKILNIERKTLYRKLEADEDIKQTYAYSAVDLPVDCPEAPISAVS